MVLPAKWLRVDVVFTHSGSFVVVSVAIFTTWTVDLVVEELDKLETLIDPEPLLVPLKIALELDKVVVLETLLKPEPLLTPLEDDTRLVNSVVGRVELVLPLLFPVCIVLPTVPVPFPASLVVLAKKGDRVTLPTVLITVTVFVVTG